MSAISFTGNKTLQEYKELFENGAKPYIEQMEEIDKILHITSHVFGTAVVYAENALADGQSTPLQNQRFWSKIGLASLFAFASASIVVLIAVKVAITAIITIAIFYLPVLIQYYIILLYNPPPDIHTAEGREEIKQRISKVKLSDWQDQVQFHGIESFTSIFYPAYYYRSMLVKTDVVNFGLLTSYGGKELSEKDYGGYYSLVECAKKCGELEKENAKKVETLFEMLEIAIESQCQKELFQQDAKMAKYYETYERDKKSVREKVDELFRTLTFDAMEVLNQQYDILRGKRPPNAQTLTEAFKARLSQRPNLEQDEMVKQFRVCVYLMIKHLEANPPERGPFFFSLYHNK